MLRGKDARRSPKPDIGFPHHATPQLHLRGYEGGEFFRGIRPRFDVEVLEARGNFRATLREIVERGRA